MTTAYVPFNDAEIIKVWYELKQRSDDFRWQLDVRVDVNKLGDLYRFVVRGSSCGLRETMWNVAKPSDDRVVPVAPSTNEDNLRRERAIRVIHPDYDTLEETIEAILLDLEEYIRTKKAQENLVVNEIVIFE